SSNGYVLSSSVSSPKMTVLARDRAYASKYSCLDLKVVLSDPPPPSRFAQTIFAKKLSSPKTSLQTFLRLSISWSPILIKMTPSSVRRFRASFNLGYIMLSQLEWYRPSDSELVESFWPSSLTCFVHSR